MANETKKVAQKIRALAHPLRLSIINYIRHKGETNVSGIYHSLKIEQSVTSQQLKILRQAGLVNNRRAGKEIFYKVNAKEIQTALDSIGRMLK